MGKKKISLERDLYHKAVEWAEKAGYSSADEFIYHILEKELRAMEADNDSAEEVEKKLRGLGYIS